MLGLCSPAHPQALNGWEPFVGEQLAVVLYVGLWESPRASLSQPLKSRDYLGQQDTLSRTPPQQGWGKGASTEVLSGKPWPHKSLSQKGSPKWAPSGTWLPAPSCPDSELSPMPGPL